MILNKYGVRDKMEQISRNSIFLLIFILFLLLSGQMVSAEEWKSENGTYQYTLDENGAVCIKSIDNASGSLQIPSQIDGHIVVQLGTPEKDFDVKNYTSNPVTELVIPDTVEKCYPSEFSLGYLKTLHLGSKVRIIASDFRLYLLSDITVSSENPYYTADDDVLYSKDGKILYCYPCLKKGSSYTLKETTEKIYEFAFEHCKYLKKVTFNEGLQSIGAYAFSDVQMKNIKLPSTLTTIEKCAFRRNLALKGTVEIPKNVKNIKNYAFVGCKKVKKWKINGKNTKIGTCALGYSLDYEGDDEYTLTSVKNTSVVAPAKSKAYTYAKKNGLKFYDTKNKKKLNYKKKTKSYYDGY